MGFSICGLEEVVNGRDNWQATTKCVSRGGTVLRIGKEEFMKRI